MKKALIIPIVIASLSLALVFFVQKNQLDHQLDTINKQNQKLENENTTLSARIKEYEDANKKVSLEQCKLDANNKYMQYIKDNSIAVKEGLTTTYTPKSDKIIGNAQSSLDADTKSCTDKLGN